MIEEETHGEYLLEESERESGSNHRGINPSISNTHIHLSIVNDTTQHTEAKKKKEMEKGKNFFFPFSLDFFLLLLLVRLAR